MDRLHDPAVLALPHPVRVDAALGAPIEASLLGGDALRDRLRLLFLDPSVTSSWLLRNVPELTRLAIGAQHCFVPAAVIEAQPGLLSRAPWRQCRSF
jgi:hypothetical protein